MDGWMVGLVCGWEVGAGVEWGKKTRVCDKRRTSCGHRWGALKKMALFMFHRHSRFICLPRLDVARSERSELELGGWKKKGNAALPVH